MSQAPSRTPGPFFALALASIALIGPLAVHLFLPVIPGVKAALDLSDALAQLTFSISLFGMAFATLVYGSLSDRYGRRPVLLSGLGLFLVGCVLSLAANSVVPLVLGRLVQAIGAGCGVTLVRSIARDAYGPERLVKAIAYLTMFYTLGPMIAPIAGGFLLDHFGWRSVFVFSLAGGAIIAAGAYFAVYETRPRSDGMRGGTGVLHSYVELFSHVRFTCFVTQSGLSTGAFMAVASASAFLMQDVMHRPATEYGFWFLAFPFGYFAGNFVSSRVAARARIETMVLTGSSLSMVAIAVLSGLLILGVMTPAAIFVPGFFITFSQGIALPYGQTGAMAVNPKLAGTAAGIGVCMQNLGGALFAQLYGVMANGTIWPLVFAIWLSAILGLFVGFLPFHLERRGR
jgi:DHA1 family bicyclomycin/chloramphenicol resistance-like MFS transporter